MAVWAGSPKTSYVWPIFMVLMVIRGTQEATQDFNQHYHELRTNQLKESENKMRTLQIELGQENQHDLTLDPKLLREKRILRLIGKTKLEQDRYFAEFQRQIYKGRLFQKGDLKEEVITPSSAHQTAVDDGTDQDEKAENLPLRKRSVIVAFFFKFFRIISMILVMVLNFTIVYPYIIGKFWTPFWQAKANSYQHQPMYRLVGNKVEESEEKLWDELKIGEPCRGYEHLHTDDYEVTRLINVQFHEFLFNCKNNLSLEVEDISSTYSTLFIPIVLTQNKNRKNANPWYYFEVEICSLNQKLDFGIGLFEKPDKDAQLSTEYVEHIAARKELGQSNKAKVGYYDNSIGFYLKSGSLIISGSTDYVFDIFDIYKKMHNPKRMFEANQSDAEHHKLDEEEVYDFAGDTVGMAYNCETGHVFLTINGEIINKVNPKLTTEINFQILEKYDKEDKDFKYDEVMGKMKKDMRSYIKNLELDKEYLDMMKEAIEIKLTPGVEFIPAIFCGGDTEFNLNIGRSPFRNVQPEFSMGLLSPFEPKKRHKYLTEDLLDDQGIAVAAKNRLYNQDEAVDSEEVDSQKLKLAYEAMKKQTTKK